MRPRPGSRRALTFLTVAAALAIAGGPTAQRPPTVTEALDLYGAGRADEAIRRLQDFRGGLSVADWVADASARSQPVERLIADATRWMKSGGSPDAARRGRTAAAFALDVVWAERQGTEDDLLARLAWSDDLISVIGWGCPLMKASTPPAAARWWYLASVAILEDAGEWKVLQGHGVTRYTLAQRSGVNAEYAQGHFSHARSQFPDEPRWRLMTMVFAENAFRKQLQTERVRLHQAGGAGPRGSEFPAEVVAMLGPGGHAPQALRDAWDALDRELRTLVVDPDSAVRVEAVLHQGYWRLCARDWAAAIETFTGLNREVLDPSLRYASAYFRGWANEQLGHRAEAIADYQRADAMMPRGRTVSTLLASQLFLDGRRPEAYGVLQAGLDDAPGAPPDPALMFGRGDARFIDGYLTRMREAVR